MIKLYITAIETKDNGQAVTLFEDYLLTFGNKEDIDFKHEMFNINNKVAEKIEEVEKINKQETSPF